jgi:N-carbamoylputrescine amidase
MEPPQKFVLALIQLAADPDPDKNLEHAAARIREAARRGAQVICLPELFRTRYFCQREDARFFDWAESIPGPTTARLGAIARDLKLVIIAPVFERRAPGLCHNSAAIIDVTGQVAGVYRKMHIPDDPAYYEKFYFTPGDLGFQAVDTGVGRVATLICWDQWYPEGARLASLRGALLLVYPTAIGWHPHEKESYGAEQLDAWRTIQRAHAIANGVYVAAVNRVGHEKIDAGPGIEFWGSSFVADPFGIVLAQGSTANEETLFAEVDPGRIEDVRRNWPFLRDRRVDAYEGISRRYLDQPSAGTRADREPGPEIVLPPGKNPKVKGKRQKANVAPPDQGPDS